MKYETKNSSEKVNASLDGDDIEIDVVVGEVCGCTIMGHGSSLVSKNFICGIKITGDLEGKRLVK